MSVANHSLIRGLERDYFLGDDIFDLETERIFSRNWICVGRIEEFGENRDESFVTFKIGSFAIAVIRKSDGSVSAFHNICRHRGTRLIDQDRGSIKNSCLTCPYHAWTYDLDGCLIGAPNMLEMPAFDRSEHGLLSVGCVNWCGFIMVNLEKANEDFETDLAPIIIRVADWELDQQELVQTLTYRVQANWKLLFQNYSECYHCPSVHPNLNRLTPYKNAKNDLTAGSILGGPMELADGIETVSVDGRHVGQVFSGLNDRQRRSVYYYTVFPNMFVSAHPDYVMVHQIQRVSNDRSLVSCHFFATAGTKPAELARAVDQWDEINRQDWNVCELTQKGIASPAYVPGPYSNLETMLMAFDRHYRASMIASGEKTKLLPDAPGNSG